MKKRSLVLLILLTAACTTEPDAQLAASQLTGGDAGCVPIDEHRVCAEEVLAECGRPDAGRDDCRAEVLARCGTPCSEPPTPPPDCHDEYERCVQRTRERCHVEGLSNAECLELIGRSCRACDDPPAPPPPVCRPELCAETVARVCAEHRHAAEVCRTFQEALCI